MSSIDNRIVNVQFNNQEFERRINDSLKSLRNLEKGMDIQGSTDGFKSLSDNLQSITDRFSTLGIVGMTALQELTRSAISAGKSMVSALVTPIKEGGKKRALNIEQAKFQFKGLGMDVEATMADADYAVQGTAYGLDEAAKVASMFGASGMRAGEKMRTSLRAVSGVAAMTGSSYEDIGNVFTKVAGQGRLMGDDLLRLSSRGINGAATLSNYMGIAEADVRKLVTKGKIDFQTFADAMDSAFGEHATAANKTFTGAMSNVRAALARIGAKFYTPFHDSLIGPLNAFRLKINEFNEYLDPMFESLSKWMYKTGEAATGWLENFSLEGFGEALPHLSKAAGNVFGALGNVVGLFYDIFKSAKDALGEIFPPASAQGLVKVTKAIKDLTGSFRLGEFASENLKNTFKGLFVILELGLTIIGAVVTGVSRVVRAILPAGQGLTVITGTIANLIVGIRDFIKESNVLEKSINVLVDIATVVGDAISYVVNAIKDYINKMVEVANASTFLEDAGAALTEVWELIVPVFEDVKASVQEFIDKAKDWWASLELVEKSSSTLESILGGLSTAIQWVAEKIEQLFNWINKIEFKKLGDGASEVADKFKPLEWVMDKINKAVEVAKDAIRGLVDIFKWMGEVISNVLTSFKDTFLEVFQGQNMKGALGGGIIMGTLYLINDIVQTIRDFFKEMTFFDHIEGILEGITGIFEGLGGVLEGFQNKLNAEALMNIAKAVALLTVAIIAMTFVDPEKLGKSIGAMGVLLAELVGSMVLLNKALGNTKIKQIGGLIAVLLMLSVATGILAGAIKKIGGMETADAVQGIAGVAIIIGTLVAALEHMSKKMQTNVAMMGLSVGMLLAFAGVIFILSQVVMRLGKMDFAQVATGLFGLAGILASIAVFTQTAGQMKIDLAGAASILIMAIAIGKVSDAVIKMGAIDVAQLTIGLGAMAAIMTLMGVFVYAMDQVKNIKGTAQSITLMSAAMVILSLAIKSLGGMDPISLAMGIGALAASMAIMVAASYGLKGSMDSALALVAMAAAMNLLVVPLVILGALPFANLAKGIGVLAAALAVLIIAGHGLKGTETTLLSLAGSVALFGAGVLAVGAGVSLLAAGLILLSGSALAVSGTITVLAQTFAALLPMLATSLALAIGAFIVSLSELGDTVLMALGKLLDGILLMFGERIMTIVTIVSDIFGLILEEILVHIPALTEVVSGLVQGVLTVIRDALPLLLEIANDFIIGFLETVVEATPLVIETIQEFIKAVEGKLGDIIQAAFEFIIEFVNALADAVRENYEEVGKAALNLIGAFIEAIFGLFKLALQTGWDLAGKVLQGIKDLIFGKKDETEDEGEKVSKGVLAGVGNFLLDALKAGVELIGKILSGIVDGVIGIGSDLLDAGVDIVKGVIGGITSWFKNLFTGGKEAAEEAAAGAKKGANDAGSGLKTAGQGIGRNLIEGAKSGISSMAASVKQTATNVFSGVLGGVKSFLGIHSPSTEFADVAYWTITGFIRKMDGMGKNLWTAGKDAGKTALTAMSDALSGIDDILDDDPNLSPVITPILNLDGVQSQWGQFAYAGLGANVSSNAAQSVANRSNDIFNSTGVKDSGVTNNEVKVSFDGAVFHVREEADIHKISAELATIIERKSRG